MGKLYQVKIRKDLAEIKENAKQIDGKIYSFELGWDIGEEDSTIYVGEIAMIPHDKTYPIDAPVWIASGDLEKVSTDKI